jgi:hypothetical protein
LQKRNAHLWGGIFKEMSILFFKRLTTLFCFVSVSTNTQKKSSTSFRSQQVFHQHFESMCWRVGGFWLLMMSVNKTKTLTKTASSMLVAWWKRQCTYLPSREVLAEDWVVLHLD